LECVIGGDSIEGLVRFFPGLSFISHGSTQIMTKVCTSWSTLN